MSEYCEMCMDASVNEALTAQNDFSAMTVGKCSEGFRIMMCSGWGKQPRLEIEHLENDLWRKIGEYKPKYCPNCGRPLVRTEETETENQRDFYVIQNSDNRFFAITEEGYPVFTKDVFTCTKYKSRLDAEVTLYCEHICEQMFECTVKHVKIDVED